MQDSEVIEYIFSKNGKIIRHRLDTMSQEMKDYITNRYNDSDSIQESIYRIKYNIETRPVCAVCDNKVVWYKSYKYKQTCSPQCAKKLNSQNGRETCLQKYGVTNVAKSTTVKEKISQINKDKSQQSLQKRKETCLQKYGVENCFQSEDKKIKARGTLVEHYGVDNPARSETIKNKIQQTCLNRYDGKSGYQSNKTKETLIERYGVDNPAKSEIIQEQIKTTCLEKYNVEHYSQTNEYKEKVKQTCLEKYGVEHYVQTADFIDKCKKTNLERYGVEYHMQSDEFKQHMSALMSSAEKQEQLNKLKQEHNTFNKSKPEDNIYELLYKKYPDIIRQYRSKLYPFNCDFYIPSLDLYIEYNGSHYHNKHPYIGSEEDLIELNKLKEKANASKRHLQSKKSQYDMIIYTWTDLDVRKRNIAKQNNLNYIEFWNITDVQNWLNNQY